MPKNISEGFPPGSQKTFLEGFQKEYLIKKTGIQPKNSSEIPMLTLCVIFSSAIAS